MFSRLPILLVSSCLYFSQAASAYEFSPVIAEFSPSGAGSARTFTVRNTQSETIALQIEVFSRSADASGAEVREPDYDNFIVTPPQMVLEPGAGRSVRVQWVGAPDVERERAFRIVASQVPIYFTQETDGAETSAVVAIGYRYEVAAYVARPGGQAQTELTASEPVLTEDGKKKLRLTIRSTGAVRAILSEPSLIVKSAGGQSVVLTKERAPELHLKNILSGTQAVIDLSWPEEIAFGPVQASLETSYLTLN